MMAHLWRLCYGCTQLIKMSCDNGNKLDYLANDMLSHKETRELQHRDYPASVQHCIASNVLDLLSDPECLHCEQMTSVNILCVE